jgi:hypothetical protein
MFNSIEPSNPSSSYILDISGSLRINESIGSGGSGVFNSGSLVLQHMNSGGLSSILFNNKQNTSSYSSITYYDNISNTNNSFPNYNYSVPILAIDCSGTINNNNNFFVIRTNGAFIVETSKKYNACFISY